MNLGKVDHHLGCSFHITDKTLFESKSIALGNKKFTFLKVNHGNFVDTWAISRNAMNQAASIFNEKHALIQSDPLILKQGLWISIIQFMLSFAYPKPFSETKIDRKAAGKIYLRKVRYFCIVFFLNACFEKTSRKCAIQTNPHTQKQKKQRKLSH